MIDIPRWAPAPTGGLSFARRATGESFGGAPYAPDTLAVAIESVLAHCVELKGFYAALLPYVAQSGGFEQYFTETTRNFYIGFPEHMSF